MQDNNAVQEEFEFGIVARYFADKGFGFIQRRGNLGHAYFNDYNVLSEQLFADQPVRFKLRPHTGGRCPVAYRVQAVE